MSTLLRSIFCFSLAANCYFLKRLLDDSSKTKKYDSNSKSFSERINYKSFRHAAKTK